jgi:hypothetical protein
MKKTVSIIFASLLVIMFPAFLSGQKADFTGTWKLDMSKIPVTGNFPVLIKITISIKGDSLLTERFYNTGDGQEYPFNENLTLDGKENTITVYDMPRKSKATWKEKDIVLIHEATTTANGSDGPVDFKSTETWTVDSVNNILTISFSNYSREVESTGAFIFNKSVEAN